MIVILETNNFYIDKRMVKQPLCPDIYDEVKWASTVGTIGGAAVDEKGTQPVAPFVGDWIHAPGVNTSLTSFTHVGSVTSHLGENCQDHSQLLSYSGQHTMPFHVEHSQWEPGPLETSFMANADCISQFTYWSQGVNALT